ncbi:MAG TPA: CusA/CzcA family heavy metal efflux RND transporter [Bacteroidales bacterium]|nr:CusA/CzcA family heavy metal efflux RND transporter [Bacteroidales bacterium]
MLDSIISFSVKNKLIVILFTLSVVAFGIYSVTKIPVGAVPDITNNQVQVITVSPNLATQDIEQFITYPVELEMANLPGVEEIRSISKFGLSVVTIVFEDKSGTYLPRQLIAEKIKSASANIPEGFGAPEMGPVTTGLGEIYQYTLDVKPEYKDRYSTMELRTLQDWVVKRQLSGIPGVIEVNTWGGHLKQYEVAIDPQKLRTMGISLVEVFEALKANNSVAGGAYIEKQNQSWFIRGDGLLKSIEDIGNVVVKNVGGIPVLINDLAEIKLGYANRYGAITGNGEGEKILGQIMMLKDANSKKVINDVKKRVEEVQKNLPEGVFINPIIDRSELISRTTFTVYENLILGCLIVMFAVILLLGNLRSALVISSIIPLSLLFTISAMYLFGADANLMSLGALDFGIIIDGAVIIVEYTAVSITSKRNELHSLEKHSRQTLMDKISFDGASKMMNSAIFGQIIILIVLIPIFSLSGVEGKMFRPMALSFSLAIVGAMIFGLTWLPAVSSFFLKPEKEGKQNFSTRITNLLYKAYCPVMSWAYDHKKTVLGLALASLIFTVFLFTKMGAEFVPTLDEGDFVIQPVLKTGTSLSKTIQMTTQMEKILLDSFPEAEQVVCRIGAAEVPTDPMSMEEIDMIIKLKPRREWVTAKSKEELAVRFKEALSVIPGVEYEFTQPIEMRFNELITGVRADIAIKVFGEDMEYMSNVANKIKKLVEGIPGAEDVILEKTEGLPQMSVKYNRQKIAFYGLTIDELNRNLTMAFGGESAGSVFEGEKRFDLVVRLQSGFRADIENIKGLCIPLPNGSFVPIKELAEINYSTGPAKISRDNTHRRVVVSMNVRNRDLQSVVNDIREEINKNIKLKTGYYIAYGGQFENLQNANRRLQLAVPVALLLIFIFLHFAFKSFKDAFMIFSAIPLAIVGGVILLWLRGMPFSVSAGIGFIALFGVAVLNGIVLIEHLKSLKESGMKDMKEIILKGAGERLRPVLITASAAALGFLPMAVSTSAGAEVQRPLATVVIGGLFTSTLLTMVALPLLYALLTKINTSETKKIPTNQNFKNLLIILMLVIPAVSFAQAPKSLNLNEAITIALKNNKEINAAELMVEQSKTMIPSAFEIDKLSIFYEYDENNIADNGYPLGVLGVEQGFAFPTIYTSQLKANKIGTSLAAAELELQKTQLVRKVTQQFYHIIYLMNKQAEYKIIDSLYDRYTIAAQLQLEQGDISKLEFLNAALQHQRITAEIQQLNHDLTIANVEFENLLQYDSTFLIPYEPLQVLILPENYQYSANELPVFEENIKLQNALLDVERNRLLPDITLGYFNGTNSYADAKNYDGYTIGIGVPLFFGEQKSKIKSGKIALEIAQIQFENRKKLLANRKTILLQELTKYRESIALYENSGKSLYDQMLKTAREIYSKGLINYCQYVENIKKVVGLRLEYLDKMAAYNHIVIQLKYLTL